MAVARVTKEAIDLMVEKSDGTILVVTAPEGSRITFGSFQMGSSDKFGQPRSTGEPTLRIYEGGEGIQLAAIPGVRRYQALGKLTVKRWDGEKLEPETPETWAAQVTQNQFAKIGARGIGKTDAMGLASANNILTAFPTPSGQYAHQCVNCLYNWESKNPQPIGCAANCSSTP